MESLAGEFGVLAQQRRLVALIVLIEHDDPLTIDELVTEVARRELDVPSAELTDEQRRQIRLSFHHVHLPKLVERGVVEYRQSTDELRLTEESANLERIIDAVFDR